MKEKEQSHRRRYPSSSTSCHGSRSNFRLYILSPEQPQTRQLLRGVDGSRLDENLRLGSQIVQLSTHDALPPKKSILQGERFVRRHDVRHFVCGRAKVLRKTKHSQSGHLLHVPDAEADSSERAEACPCQRRIGHAQASPVEKRVAWARIVSSYDFLPPRKSRVIVFWGRLNHQALHYIRWRDGGQCWRRTLVAWTTVSWLDLLDMVINTLHLIELKRFQVAPDTKWPIFGFDIRNQVVVKLYAPQSAVYSFGSNPRRRSTFCRLVSATLRVIIQRGATVVEFYLDKVGWCDSIDTLQMRLEKGLEKTLNVRRQTQDALHNRKTGAGLGERTVSGVAIHVRFEEVSSACGDSGDAFTMESLVRSVMIMRTRRC